MNRKRLDRALIVAFFALAITLLVVVIEAKVSAEKRFEPVFSTVDISEATTKRLTKLDLSEDDICPITVAGTTHVATTEEHTIPQTEQKTEEEVVYIPEPETEERIEIREEEYSEPEPTENIEIEDHPQEYDAALYSPSYFRRMGIIYWGGWTWTWYSERVLPGTGLNIPGRYTDDMGYVRDGDGYICLASDSLGYGAVINTPFGGHGKVYDCGCGSYDIVDVYVGW